jgi:hypothetical protein
LKTGHEVKVVNCREAFVDGDVRADSVDELLQVRENFWTAQNAEGAGDYRSRVASEFDKLRDLPAGTEVNLWFEYELFCHVNLWFCVWLLRDSSVDLFRVAPEVLNESEIWDGFGKMYAGDLKRCFLKRVKFTESDRALGAELWEAYSQRDHTRLRELSLMESSCFPYLKEACEAEIDKDFRPKQILEELQREGVEDFGKMFAAFREKAGVYGYGDDQVRRILGDA